MTFKYVVTTVQTMRIRYQKVYGSPTGPDKIYPRVLKKLASEIAEPLYVIFKESLRQSVIPTDWRRTNVTPIFKKGSRQSAANYRPLSLTSVDC